MTCQSAVIPWWSKDLGITSVYLRSRYLRLASCRHGVGSASLICPRGVGVLPGRQTPLVSRWPSAISTSQSGGYCSIASISSDLVMLPSDRWPPALLHQQRGQLLERLNVILLGSARPEGVHRSVRQLVEQVPAPLGVWPLLEDDLADVQVDVDLDHAVVLTLTAVHFVSHILDYVR